MKFKVKLILSDLTNVKIYKDYLDVEKVVIGLGFIKIDRTEGITEYFDFTRIIIFELKEF